MRRRRNGARSATLHFVLEDRRVDEVLERAIGLERLVLEVQAALARADSRVGQLEGKVRELEQQRDQAGLDRRRRDAAAAGKASAKRRLDKPAAEISGEVKP